MKRLNSLIILILFSVVLSAQTLVEKVFDFNEIDRAYDIIQLDEGGFLILASTTDEGGGKSVFIRLDENGDTLWTKKRQYYGYSIVQYDTSTFYIAGSYFGSGPYSYGILNKLDSNFDRVWLKTDSVSGADVRLSNIKKNQNNDLAVKYYLKIEGDMFPPIEQINIYDSSGVPLYQIADCMDLADYEQLSNTDYVVATKYESGAYPDFIEIRDSTDALKNKINVSDLTTGQNEIVLNNDTVYVIGGYQNFKIIDGVVIYRLDPDYDDLSWNMQYASLTGHIASACNGSVNSILILGNVDGSRSSAYILNVSSTGDSISTSIIDKFPTIYPVKIISNEESYFMIATIENEDESRDIYFLKAALDTVLVDIGEPTRIVDNNYFSLYPSPASSQVNIVFNRELTIGMSVVVNNISGKKVLEKKIINGTESISINTENWKKGIYFVSLYRENEHLQSLKVMIN